MDNLQNKINRLKRAVSDMHSMPAPMDAPMEAPMMDMNRDVNTDRCPDGSVPGPMGCPVPPEVGCCVQQAGNIQFPLGIMSKEECDNLNAVYLGDGTECPKSSVKNLIKILDRVIEFSKG
jgi:hypothetical protein